VSQGSEDGSLEAGLGRSASCTEREGSDVEGRLIRDARNHIKIGKDRKDG